MTVEQVLVEVQKVLTAKEDISRSLPVLFKDDVKCARCDHFFIGMRIEADYFPALKVY